MGSWVVASRLMHSYGEAKGTGEERCPTERPD